jgi:molybdopterin/thiamine biosynthesis adenylyltransferase
MADPHSEILEREYAANADRARSTVAAAFDLERVGVGVLPDGANRGRFRDVWSVRLESGFPVSHLFVAIPWVFPDELPDVYSPVDLTVDGARIPHVDCNRQVCTFDDSTRFPNLEKPGEAVIEVIHRAVKIIGDGLAGPNRNDYLEEFEAYWSDGTKNLTRAIVLVRPEGPNREVVRVLLHPKVGQSSLLFAEDEAEALNFLDALGRSEKPSSKRAFYLHLESMGEILSIRRNGDVRRSLPSSAYEDLLQFLNDDVRPSTVIVSIPVAEDRVFGGWVHNEYATTTYKGLETKRTLGQAPGFRRGHLPPDTELCSAFFGQPVSRIVMGRVDAERLAGRTVGSLPESSRAMNLIGCGAVGGFIARGLAHEHPLPLRLVDPEILETFNVPRHVCDLTDVGTNKAEAVRRLLRRSNPHLNVEALPRDVREILRTDAAALMPADLSIVAVANLAVERLMNRLARSLNLGITSFVWVEPNAIAGHAVIIPPKALGCFECLVKPTGSVNCSVLDKPEAFTRVDAGCRGSFVPYGGIDLELFATTITREISRAKPTSAGIVVTWVGNLDEARRNGCSMDPKWEAVPNYTVHQSSIVPRATCSVCGS